MQRLVIVTGLSGSGKSSALNALEDIDFYAVDNLPVKILENFLEVLDAGESGFEKIALVMDLRDQNFLANYQPVFERVLKKYDGVEILFLDSSEEALIRRFSETRRKHPLSTDDAREGIQKEKSLLHDLKELSTSIIDTSSLSVHELKREITQRYGSALSPGMKVRVISFGYKHGTPNNCDLLLDVRFLQNPHFVAELKPYTGLDTPVQSYIDEDPRSQEFLDKTESYLKFLIPQYAQEGKRYLTIGIGCTGGKHRSVYMAHALTERLKAEACKDFPVSLKHEHLRLL